MNFPSAGTTSAPIPAPSSLPGKLWYPALGHGSTSGHPTPCAAFHRPFLASCWDGSRVSPLFAVQLLADSSTHTALLPHYGNSWLLLPPQPRSGELGDVWTSFHRGSAQAALISCDFTPKPGWPCRGWVPPLALCASLRIQHQALMPKLASCSHKIIIAGVSESKERIY